jgi:hypothetical protein
MLSEEKIKDKYKILKKEAENRECKLIITEKEFIKEGKNKTQIAEIMITYITKCGHINSMRVITFLQNKDNIICNNCRHYSKIQEELKNRECELYMTIDEFIEEHEKAIKDNGDNKSMCIRYRAKCGHIYKLTLSTLRTGAGNICRECVNKINYTTNVDGSSTKTSLEDSGILLVTELLQDKYKMELTDDGCLADLAIKLKTEEEDKWTQIQVKTTSTITKHGCSFNIPKKYNNCIILCILLKENYTKFWMFNGNKIKVKNINIGKRSKYGQNEIKEIELYDKLEQEFKQYIQYKFDVINIPVSKEQQKEQKFRKLRESKCNFLKSQNPIRTGLKHDFKVNNFKIQEKVCNYLGEYGIRASSDNPYKEGDNAFYWFHFPDEKRFLLLNEQKLIERDYIKIDAQEGKTRYYFNITDERYKNHVFNYDDPELKDKLFPIFSLNI